MSTNIHCGLGYLPDDLDVRDKLFRARKIEAPIAASVWSDRCAIKDQGSSSSCVGQAISQGLRLAHLMAGTDCPELSARFAYRLSLTVHGSESDDGTYLRTAMQAVKALGCSTEEAFPFASRRVLDPIPLSAVMSSHDRRGLRGYQRISTGDVERVKQAIASGYPVVAGWDVSQAFVDWDGRDPVGAQTTGIVGGHAMAIVGYDGDVFDLVNSWGVGWGRSGHALAKRSFVAQARDVWILDVRGDA